MSNKKIISFCLLIVITVLMISGCANRSYGTAYKSQDELKTAMEKENIKLAYPSYMGEKNSDSTQSFIAEIDQESKKVIGYKIYNFGEPFFVSVAAYSQDNGIIQSDDINRLTKETSIQTEKGQADLYQGLGYKDSLFLIATINLDAKRYEVRVTANKETESNIFINAIYKDTEKYDEAIGVLKAVINGLQIF